MWSCQKAMYGPGRTRWQVIGDTWKRLAAKPHRDGHLRVVLCNADGHRNWQVHRLVLLAFVGPCPDGMIGCHADDNPTNNTPGNLRWDLPAGNFADRDRNGRTACGSRHGRTPFTEDDVRAIRRAYAAGVTHRVLARQYGVAQSGMWNIVSGKSWTHVKPDPPSEVLGG